MKKKPYRLEIRLSKDERAEIEKASKLSKVDMSKYIRETLHNRSKRLIAKASKPSC